MRNNLKNVGLATSSSIGKTVYKFMQEYATQHPSQELAVDLRFVTRDKITGQELSSQRWILDGTDRRGKVKDAKDLLRVPVPLTLRQQIQRLNSNRETRRMVFYRSTALLIFLALVYAMCAL